MNFSSALSREQFVESFSMKSFYVSAKTGDNVNTCFHKVAADLAGIALTKPEVEVAAKVVKAELIDHPGGAVSGDGGDKRAPNTVRVPVLVLCACVQRVLSN